MEAAKDTVKKFTSKSGHHDTTLHEKTAPTVQNETISQTQHDRHTTAVDREVHQDHYHTTEQPVTHSEVLPEQHHHRAIPVEHRSFEHDDSEKLKRGLENERKRYQDTQTRVEGEKTHTENPVVAGEHVHHHVHETIQPVVNKQTVEPHVVHTTVPIHEVHHNQAQHHAASSLPPMSMEDFKKQGGALGGQEEKTTFFPEGQPRSIRGHKLGEDCDAQDSVATSGRKTAADRVDVHSHDRPVDGESSHTNGSEPGFGKHVGTDGQIAGATDSRNGSSVDSTTSHKKPSLLDRLNPKKDADGDGKAGFMK